MKIHIWAEMSINAAAIGVSGRTSETLTVVFVQLKGTEHSGALDLLRLFAHGIWSDYKSNAQMLPALEPQQELKLKQLTVMTLAERSKVDICYGSPIFESSIMLNQVETPRYQKQTAIKHRFYALVPQSNITWSFLCVMFTVSYCTVIGKYFFLSSKQALFFILKCM
jgi:hypothetical protein